MAALSDGGFHFSIQSILNIRTQLALHVNYEGNASFSFHVVPGQNRSSLYFHVEFIE